MTAPKTTPIRHTQEYISLRDYIDLRLESMCREMKSYHAITDKRLDALDDDIRSLRESRAELSGKASQTSVFVTLIISLASLLLSIFRMLGF